jgi:hypothetical protein
MTPSRTVLLSISLTMVFFVIAGCISQPAAENRTSNATVNVTTIPPVATPTQTICPIPIDFNKRKITTRVFMNPIRDQHIGDIIEINGTIQTKNGVVDNKTIQVYIFSSYILPRGGIRYDVFRGYANIQPGECEVKTWFVFINLTTRIGGYPLYPGEYLLSAQTSDDTSNFLFNITEPSPTVLTGGKDGG